MILPETCEPTCTVTTAFGLPVAEIVESTPPLWTGAVRYCVPACRWTNIQTPSTQTAATPAAISDVFIRGARIRILRLTDRAHRAYIRFPLAARFYNDLQHSCEGPDKRVPPLTLLASTLPSFVWRTFCAALRVACIIRVCANCHGS